MLLFDFIEIGNRLYSYRKALGLTQEEVAERAELSLRTYADMERGSVNIRMQTLLKICQVLGITPDDILTRQATAPAPTEAEILARLARCSPQDRATALRLVATYLDSLGV